MPRIVSSARFALLATLAWLAGSACAQDRDAQRLLTRADKLAATIESLQIEDKFSIPASIMQEAKGVIVLRQYEAGFIFGAKGGYGMALVKDNDGNWGPPIWIKTGEISGGLQAGAHSLKVVFVIMSDRGLRMLRKTRFRIGVDASVTVGPTSANANARSGAAAELLAYTDTEGLYAGATFDGGFLLPDNKANARTYQQELTVTEIIESVGLTVPDYGHRIAALLRAIEHPQDASRLSSKTLDQENKGIDLQL